MKSLEEIFNLRRDLFRHFAQGVTLQNMHVHYFRVSANIVDIIKSATLSSIRKRYARI
jgi:hypothetical protein